jgi:hypothetical protein
MLMLMHPAPAKLTNNTSRRKQKHQPNLTFGPIYTKLRNLPSTTPSNYKSLPTTNLPNQGLSSQKYPLIPEL